eukprot:CAMPEP_0118924806 /NCGR_PEP_ID=MMETSP1169-20130426/2768_1 /TAXON_ID=36882 /ORGANISM="Pyramimonas obovata, Strain CCMP722" /LENGTH=112 /DNA_ID=CAMNT_0006865939 /DNA_START=44 /DNA_END=382 /DNA_ORIENTATION=-
MTGPEVDVITFSPEGHPVYVQEMDAETMAKAPLTPMDEYVKEWPSRLRESSAEKLNAPSKQIGMDLDVDDVAKQASTLVEKTFFQALGWAKAAQDQLGILTVNPDEQKSEQN